MLITPAQVLVAQLVVAAVALPVGLRLVQEAVQRRSLAAAAAAVAVLAHGAGVLVALLPESADAVQSGLNALGHIAVLLLLGTYPNGRLVPRWTVLPVATGIALQCAELASGFALSEQAWWPWHLLALWVVLLAGGQVTRYRRRATEEERRRLCWPLLALVVTMDGFTVLSALLAGIAGDIEARGWGTAASVLLNSLVPLGFATGLLAPGLFRVDRALPAVLAVSAVALAETGVTALAVALVPAAISTTSAPVWAAALVVGVTVVPLARVARRLADRLVFGTTTDPLRALADLGARLSSTGDADEVATTIAATIGRALALRGVAVTLRDGRRAVWGERVTGEAHPVLYRGETVATIVAAPRAAEPDLTQRDRELIDQLAVQAAPALHAAESLDRLQIAKARLVHAREEERRRLRRDLHDDLGPTFAGLTLSGSDPDVRRRR